MLSLLLAAAAPQVPMKPSGPWNVEAQEDLCVLSRVYGTGSDRIVLGFQPIFDQDRMDVVVALDSAPGSQHEGTATIERQPDGRQFKGSYVGLKTTVGNRYLTRMSVDRAIFDELDKTTTLRIKAGPVSRTVQIIRFEKARPVFQKCERDLLTSWGVDPASLADDRRPTLKGSPARYFPSSSYPAQARDSGYVGRTTVVLNVDAAGAVTKCRVVVGAGKQLNDATCAQAMKIPFNPGKDASGADAPSIFVLRARWML